jgi:hypothetical protein
MGGIQTSV